MSNNPHELNKAYSDAINFTTSHYENFPVVSFFIPKYLRKHVAIVYQFARQADDIADEGNLTSDERILELNKYKEEYLKAINGNPSNSFWSALTNSINGRRLSPENFIKLLRAFEQDIVKKRYENFKELSNYCSNSANPVGRIILELHSIFDEESNQHSDEICTALQLTNFYQDISIDMQKERIYIPLDELRKFNVTEEMFQLRIFNSNFKALIEFQVDRTEKLFNEGKKLLEKLPFRLRHQIHWTIRGGEAILKKIRKNNFDVLNNSPTLSKLDFLKLLVGI